MPRKVRLLPVPTGDRLLELLPRLGQALDGSGDPLLPVDLSDVSAAASILGADPDLVAGEDDEDDPTALVVATSGSTGQPKGVLLPASALRASADATRQRLSSLGVPGGRLLWSGGNSSMHAAASKPRAGASEPHAAALRGTGATPTSDQWLLALPATHIAGLQVLLRAVRAGAEPTVLDTAVPFTADRFCAVVQRMPAGPRFTSLVPTQLVRVLTDPEATAALTTFDAVLVGGAAAPAELLRQAAKAGAAVVTTYGMTETCGGCVYDGLPLGGVLVDLDDDGSPGDDRLGREGRSIVGDDHRPGVDARQAPNQHPGATHGRVIISGPVLARGYRGMPGHPAFQRLGGSRLFRTQDVGSWDGDLLRITGRIDDVIVTGGVKIDPSSVESAVAGVHGVREVLVTGVPDREWGQLVVAVVVVPEDQPAPRLDALRAAALQAHGAAAAPRHLVLVDELPYRGIGKPDRRALGELAVRALAEPPHDAGQRWDSSVTDMRSDTTAAGRP